MKKKLLLAPLMAVLVACVVVLSGCGGPSVEELITEDLTTQFDEVKNGGDDFLAGLEEASGDEFEQLGIDPKEYAKSYLEGFDYKIGDVTVDEDKGTATAEVTITCKSMNQIVEDFSSQYQEKVAALDTVPSDDELYKMCAYSLSDEGSTIAVYSSRSPSRVKCTFGVNPGVSAWFSIGATTIDATSVPFSSVVAMFMQCCICTVASSMPRPVTTQPLPARDMLHWPGA